MHAKKVPVPEDVGLKTAHPDWGGKMPCPLNSVPSLLCHFPPSGGLALEDD